MVVLIRALIIAVLAAIAGQNFKSRSVYWFWFPALALLFIADLKLFHHVLFIDIGYSILINSGFLFAQLLLVSIYFSIKLRQCVNVTNNMLGWGDILLLLGMACYLSPLNYIFFYVCSLMAVMAIFITRYLLGKKYEQVPLAGLQAVLLAGCLMASWACPRFALTDDTWARNLIMR